MLQAACHDQWLAMYLVESLQMGGRAQGFAEKQRGSHTKEAAEKCHICQIW
jgi:predicted nucleic acid binding AN1-type Zn finger protein